MEECGALEDTMNNVNNPESVSYADENCWAKQA